MNLSLIFFTLSSVWNSVHGEDSTSLRGNRSDHASTLASAPSSQAELSDTFAPKPTQEKTPQNKEGIVGVSRAITWSLWCKGTRLVADRRHRYNIGPMLTFGVNIICMFIRMNVNCYVYCNLKRAAPPRVGCLS